VQEPVREARQDAEPLVAFDALDARHREEDGRGTEHGLAALGLLGQPILEGVEVDAAHDDARGPGREEHAPELLAGRVQ
jgi:hypothetical protein